VPYEPNHPVFRKPDERAKLWRYVDLARFVEMLESGALFFARADKLGDRFEGSTTRPTKQAIRDHAKAQGWADEWVESTLEMLKRSNGLAPRTHFVSCWHESEYESEAMWKLYADGRGVAVQSSFSRLSEALADAKPLIYIGVVEYVDYDNAVIPGGNSYWPFMHKRLSLAHEHEVRAITSGFERHVYQRDSFDLPGVRDELLQEAREQFDVELDPQTLEPPLGLHIPVRLEVLIERVFVTPDAPNWLGDLVRAVIARYALNVQVDQSRLGEDPIF
jgi:hypothetical protein